MKARPIAVTIIGWLFVASGTIGLVHEIVELASHTIFHADELWIFPLNVAAVVAGLFLLKGCNWARWLALAWMGFHVVNSFLNSWQQALTHAVIFLLIAYFLFRPESTAYFRAPENGAGEP